MYSEEELFPLSALQHYVFCPRQCALIHIEQVWIENLFTAQGRVMHENAHEGRAEKVRGVRIERGVPLRSFELGLSGKADVVEFHEHDGKWIPYPVEYKRGKPKRDNCDKVQLCAQAMCLEEMLGVKIIEGALFYGKTRHRLEVCFDDALRRETKQTAEEVHLFLKKGRTPQPEFSKKCSVCSLVDYCIPETVARHEPVKEYLKREVEREEIS